MLKRKVSTLVVCVLVMCFMAGCSSPAMLGIPIGNSVKRGNQPVLKINGNKDKKTISLQEANAKENQYLNKIGYTTKEGGYPIVDTGQIKFYNDSKQIQKPDTTDDFYGQDANYTGNTPSYTDNGDGTITDNVTGLMWQKNPAEKMTWQEAMDGADKFRLANYSDWRLPTIKELYSLIQFNGVTGQNAKASIPYIDTNYFNFQYGDVTGERFIDSQYATSTIYDSTTFVDNTTMFGVNFADGRIKGYPIDKKTFYVMYVRGNKSYGMNRFVDNKDGTISDLATGLMWMKYDSGYMKAGYNGAMDYKEALKWSEGLNYAGYEDWKLPNAKELQSIVDYTRSPNSTNSAAIDKKFQTTTIIDIDGKIDYPYFWSSTTHLDGINQGSDAVYVAFGKSLGYMNSTYLDVHGAGAQRSDPKSGNKNEYPSCFDKAPQGDVRVVYNFIRAVRIIKSDVTSEKNN